MVSALNLNYGSTALATEPGAPDCTKCKLCEAGPRAQGLGVWGQWHYAKGFILSTTLSTNRSSTFFPR